MSDRLTGRVVYCSEHSGTSSDYTTDGSCSVCNLLAEVERLMKTAYDQAERIHDLEKQLLEYENAQPTD